MNSASLNSEIPVFCEVLVYLNMKHVPYSREEFLIREQWNIWSPAIETENKLNPTLRVLIQYANADLPGWEWIPRYKIVNVHLTKFLIFSWLMKRRAKFIKLISNFKVRSLAEKQWWVVKVSTYILSGKRLSCSSRWWAMTTWFNSSRLHLNKNDKSLPWTRGKLPYCLNHSCLHNFCSGPASDTAALGVWVVVKRECVRKALAWPGIQLAQL